MTGIFISFLIGTLIINCTNLFHWTSKLKYLPAVSNHPSIKLLTSGKSSLEMHSILKFCFQFFCINFCPSDKSRKCLLAVHVANFFATLMLILTQHFEIPLFGSDSPAARIWFFCGISVYTIVFLEGYQKDRQFNRDYSQWMRDLCERHENNGKDYYAFILSLLIFFDFVYIILLHYAHSLHLVVQYSVLVPKLSMRFRVWSYFRVTRSVLFEFENIIEKVKNTSRSATQEEFLTVQQEYSDLWRTTTIIGENYVLSLCSIFFYISFEVTIYLFWLFTVDFNSQFLCELLANSNLELQKNSSLLFQFRI